MVGKDASSRKPLSHVSQAPRLGTLILLCPVVALAAWQSGWGAPPAAAPKAAPREAAPATPAAAPAAKVNVADQAGQPPQIMAVVNGEQITRPALAKECLTRHGQDVLDTLVNKHIILQACQTRGISITDKDVN